MAGLLHAHEDESYRFVTTKQCVEETMIREVRGEIGISIKKYNFLSVYSGKRVMYNHSDSKVV